MLKLKNRTAKEMVEPVKVLLSKPSGTAGARRQFADHLGLGPEAQAGHGRD